MRAEKSEFPHPAADQPHSDFSNCCLFEAGPLSILAIALLSLNPCPLFDNAQIRSVPAHLNTPCRTKSLEVAVGRLFAGWFSLLGRQCSSHRIFSSSQVCRYCINYSSEPSWTAGLGDPFCKLRPTIKFMITSLQKGKVNQSHKGGCPQPTLILFSVIVLGSSLVFSWFWGVLKFPNQSLSLLLLRVAHPNVSSPQLKG